MDCNKNPPTFEVNNFFFLFNELDFFVILKKCFLCFLIEFKKPFLHFILRFKKLINISITELISLFVEIKFIYIFFCLEFKELICFKKLNFFYTG